MKMVRSNFEYVRKLFEIGVPGALLVSVLYDELAAFIDFDALTLVWREPGASVARVIHESQADVHCRSVDIYELERMFTCSAAADLSVDSQFPPCGWLAGLVSGESQTLAVYLANGGRPRGVILLHRSGNSVFSVTEKAALVRLARAFSCSLTAVQPAVPLIANRARAGIFLMDRGATIIEASSYGRKLLRLAAASDDGTHASQEVSLLVSLHNHFSASNAGARPNFVVSNSWGTFELSSHSLPRVDHEASGRWVVMVYRREPLALRVFRNCRTFALTCKQMDVALLLVSGLSNDAAATKLNIRATTVADHARKIYEKVGATNRRDLVTALILGERRAAHLWPGRERLSGIGLEGGDIARLG
jgi:DNA-binding CsgD family transcriptional regulator